MALRIPMQEAPGSGFGRSFQGGASFYNKIMEQALQRKQFEEAQRQFNALEPTRQANLQHLIGQERRDEEMSPFEKMMKQVQIQHYQNQNKQGMDLHPLEMEMKRLALEKAKMPEPEKEHSFNSNLGKAISDFKQFEKQFGINSPEAQMASQGIQSMLKEEQAKSPGAPTPATMTANQAVLQGADLIVPELQSLLKMDVPAQTSSWLSPNLQKAYEAKTASIVDGMVAAFGWPNTTERLKLGKEIVRKGSFESDDAYKNRIKGLIHEIQKRRGRAAEIIGGGNTLLSPPIEE